MTGNSASVLLLSHFSKPHIEFQFLNFKNYLIDYEIQKESYDCVIAYGWGAYRYFEQLPKAKLLVFINPLLFEQKTGIETFIQIPILGKVLLHRIAQLKSPKLIDDWTYPAQFEFKAELVNELNCVHFWQKAFEQKALRLKQKIKIILPDNCFVVWGEKTNPMQKKEFQVFETAKHYFIPNANQMLLWTHYKEFEKFLGLFFKKESISL